MVYKIGESSWRLSKIDQKKNQGRKKSEAVGKKTKQYDFIDQLNFFEKIYISRDTVDSLNDLLPESWENYNIDAPTEEEEISEFLITENAAKNTYYLSYHHQKLDEVDVKILKVLDVFTSSYFFYGDSTKTWRQFLSYPFINTFFPKYTDLY